MIPMMDCAFVPNFVAQSRAEIHSEIERHGLVLLKNYLDPMQALKLRQQAYQWRRKKVDQPNSYDSFRLPNFTMSVRFDSKEWDPSAGNIMYEMNRTPTWHNYIRFSDIDAVQNEVPALSLIAEAMEETSNLVNGSCFQVGWEEQQAKNLKFNFELLHYPRGGGHISTHNHQPAHDQAQVSLILGLSNPGEDYQSGGTVFYHAGKTMDTSLLHGMGDLILFKTDLVHQVKPCDPNLAPEAESAAGRWTAILPVYPGRPA